MKSRHRCSRLSRHYRFLIMAAAFAGMLFSALGQTVGTVAGVVIDAMKGGNVVGARVEIVGTNLFTATDDGGRFRLNNVPVGSRTLAVGSLGYAEGTQAVEVREGVPVQVSVQLKSEIVTMGKFVVSTYASQQAVALSRQRQSDRIANVISADSIGEMPDDNLRMALNRLAGINVAGGDDGLVSIRGMEGKLNSVVLDGDALPSAAVGLTGYGNQGQTRGINLRNIPTEVIQGIEVIKTPTPDLDGDAIGGRVDLKTANAFDFRERIARVSGEYRTHQYGGSGYAGSVTYGDVFNQARTAGVFLNLSWKDYSREFGQYNVTYVNPNQALTGAPALVNEINPNRQYEESQELAFNASFDWKLSHTTRLSFKGWYNRSEKFDDRPRVQLQFRDVAANNLTEASGLKAAGVGRIRVRKRDRIRPDRDFEQIRLAVKGETTAGNSLFTYGITYGQSRFTATEYDFTYEANFNNVAWSWDRTRDRVFPAYTLSAGTTDLFNNVAAYPVTDVLRRARDNTDDNLTFNADWKVDFKADQPFSLKTGFKGRMEDRANAGQSRRFTATAGASLATVGTVGFSTYDRFQDLGFVANDLAFTRYLDTNADNPALFRENQVTGAQEEAEIQAKIEENVWAGYAMGTLDIRKLRLVGGLRYELTDATYRWPASRANRGAMVFRDVTNQPNYGTMVPSVIGIYRFTQNDVLRAGWSRTLSRPDWDSLIPVDTSLTLAVVDPNSLITGNTIDITVRNPQLSAQRSDNLDLSFEHYYGSGNLVSIGYFYKKMDNYIGAPIARLTNQPAINPITGLPLRTNAGAPVFFRVSRPENGVIQEIRGVEAIWQHRFKRLPGWLSGLGFNTNYAYIDGTRKAPLFANAASPYTVTGFQNFSRVENQPKHIFHAQVYWEQRGFSARAGYNYTGSQVTVFDRRGPGVDYIRDTLEAVDVSLGYEFKSGWKIYVEGNNITGEPEDTRYTVNRNYVETYDLDGKAWTVGVRAKF